MTLKFIDLFAGIGGFRQGMEKSGYECVFSAEIDDNACEVYEANYGENPKCDITKYDGLYSGLILYDEKLEKIRSVYKGRTGKTDTEGKNWIFALHRWKTG